MANLILEKAREEEDQRKWSDDAECSFCGGFPHAAWAGKRDVFVCARCATSILPKLIADASMGSPFNYNEGKVLRAVEKHFWKAVAWLNRKYIKYKFRADS